MTLELWIPLATFALASVITPGPNNLMMMASGANFGFVRTIPHMFGVGLGFSLMCFLVGIGIMQVFERWPLVHTAMLAMSVAYLLYLAWRIANARPRVETKAGSRPLTFLQASAFQWINPKAWTMAASTITLYAPDRSLTAVLWVAATYVGVSCISAPTWTLLGRQTAWVLGRPERLRAFNKAMAVVLVATVLPAAWHSL